MTEEIIELTTELGNEVTLLRCPFCNGKASLRSKDERVGYDEYMRFVESIYVTCTKCGARTSDFRKKPLCETTPYKVRDFRENPVLRARVEDEYAVYCEQLQQKAIRAWNKRPATADWRDVAFTEEQK